MYWMVGLTTVEHMDRRFLFVYLIGLALGSMGCIITDETFDFGDESFGEGGDTSTFDATEGAFSQPVGNISEENRRSFATGQSLFRLDWEPDQVGPIFNAIACSDCHVNDGRGRPDGVGLLFRLSVPGPSPEPTYGSQFQPRGIRSVAGEGRVLVNYREIEGRFDDGTRYTLRDPEYRFVDLNYGPMARDVQFSPRLAQQMIGLGLLEAIPEESILRRADPDDADGDGISGRPNWVEDIRSRGVALGRFGWKAGQPTLEQQNAAAFHGDLGMTSSLFTDGPCTTRQTDCLFEDFGLRELSDEQLGFVTHYTQLIGPPAPRIPESDQVQRGEALFESAQCSTCHVPEWQTGTVDLPELSQQTIRPYTDLLLHDMGDGLADHRPEADANGREWRTPPLWGIGMLERVNGHQFLLHDGRARNVSEAILWHGGEAETSRDTFLAMSREERAALVAFVESL